MIYKDASAPGDLRLRHLGQPPKQIWDADGVLLVGRVLSAERAWTATARPRHGDEEDLPF